ncbi:hypothetical protein ACFL6F_00870 [Planctomycetota bacterium]
MKDSRVELLSAHYLEDSLTPEEEHELVQELRKRPELIDKLSSMVRLNEELSRSLSSESRAEYNIRGTLRLIQEAETPSSHSSKIRSIQHRIQRTRHSSFSIVRLAIAASLFIAVAAAFYFTAVYQPSSLPDGQELKQALTLIDKFKDQENRKEISKILNRVLNRNIASGRINTERFISLVNADNLTSVSWMDQQAETVRFLVSHARNKQTAIQAGFTPPSKGPDEIITFDVPPSIKKAIETLKEGMAASQSIQGETWLHGWIAYQRKDYNEAARIFYKEIENQDSQLSCLITFLFSASCQRLNLYNRMEIMLDTIDGKPYKKGLLTETGELFAALSLFTNGITSLYERERPLRARHYFNRLTAEYPDSTLTGYFRKHLKQKTEKASEQALSLQNAIPFKLKEYGTKGKWKLKECSMPDGLIVVSQNSSEVNMGKKHGVCYLTQRVFGRDFYTEWRFDLDELSKNTDAHILGVLSLLNYDDGTTHYTSLPQMDAVKFNVKCWVRFKVKYHYIAPRIGFFKCKMWIEGTPEPEYQVRITPGKGVAPKVALGVDMKGCSGTLSNFGLTFLPPLTEEELAPYEDRIEQLKKELHSEP